MFCRETGTYEEEEDVEALDMGGMTATDIVLHNFRRFDERTKLCSSGWEDFSDCCPQLFLPSASGLKVFALYFSLIEVDNGLYYLPHPVRPVVRGTIFAGETLSPQNKIKIRNGVRGKEEDACLEIQRMVIRALKACAEAVCCVTMEGMRTDKGQARDRPRTGHGHRMRAQRSTGRAETVATVQRPFDRRQIRRSADEEWVNGAEQHGEIG